MASDATGPQASAGDEWIVMDLGRLSLGEVWRLGATAGERFKLLLIKAQGLRVKMPVALPRGFRWRDRADSVQPWAEALFATAQPALEALGMRPVATMSLPTLPASENTVIARVLWAEDGRSWTELGAVPQQGGRGPRLLVSCWSVLEDGSALDTTDDPPRLATPPQVHRVHRPGAPADLYRHHQARLAGATPLLIRPEEVVPRIAQLHDAVTSFHEGRGVYVRLSSDEVAARRRAEQGGPAVAPTVKAPTVWRSPLVLATIAASALYVMCSSSSSPPEWRPPVLAMWRPTPLTVKASEEQLARALAPLRDRLAASRRPVARVTLEDLALDLATVSKVGGAPYLAPGASMPETDTGGPMVLLAQVNFVELPSMPGYPRAGMLQFFIARDDAFFGMRSDEATHRPDLRQRAFRVRFVEDVDPEAVTPRVAVRCGGGCMTPHDPTRPRRMRFAVGEEPISASDVGFPAAIGVEPGPWVIERAEAWGVDDTDLAERAFPSAGGHKLGGYPYFTQFDPREPGSPFRLLLQLDSDEDLMWGDAGIGAFFITPDDLAARDFSRVLYSWDCH
jgi:uncharacterized protein YwqG